MKTYARISSGTVAEIIGPLTDDDSNEIPISERFVPAIVGALVDISSSTTQPKQGWKYDGATFSAPSF
ncbi:hypothetical protein [Burkholderia sp. ABCPW 14]|uniref:hypothetical protein n=1 Tax=Burkholderia sp. ABCPW 14 TaxID=1637860 RepID=UPI000AA70EE5|nr:hypothetical protein [Burkholderia sp. ABCPW 14]